jgi:hypothetical protein
MGKATPHPADRQPCGYKSTHQRGAIACPWYQSLRNRVGYFGGTGKILGLGFRSFFFVFDCLFCVSVVRSRLFVCTFWLHNLVFKQPFFNKNQMISAASILWISSLHICSRQEHRLTWRTGKMFLIVNKRKHLRNVEP